MNMNGDDLDVKVPVYLDGLAYAGKIKDSSHIAKTNEIDEIAQQLAKQSGTEQKAINVYETYQDKFHTLDETANNTNTTRTLLEDKNDDKISLMSEASYRSIRNKRDASHSPVKSEMSSPGKIKNSRSLKSLSKAGRNSRSPERK